MCNKNTKHFVPAGQIPLLHQLPTALRAGSRQAEDTGVSASGTMETNKEVTEDFQKLGRSQFH